MAIVTGGQQTYSTVGNREDLSDMIFDISPVETPFASAAPRVKAKAVFHE